MQTSHKTVEVFTTVDGTEFLDLALAEAHEEQIVAERKRRDSIHYYSLSYEPDLTEGRGFGRRLFIAVEPHEFIGVQYFVDILLRELTKPIEYVQGVAPCMGYVCTETDELTFLETKCPRLFVSNGSALIDYPEPMEVLNISLDKQTIKNYIKK